MLLREFTGRHALIVFLMAFGTIIAVNALLAINAVRTFPGLEVENSYVASQEFDAKRRDQEALGWAVRAEMHDGNIHLMITDKDSGAPIEVAELQATLGRSTHPRDDFSPEFRFEGTAYVATVKLAPGNWNIRMVALADDGTEFTQRVRFYIKG
ncbi:MAG: FixH family protein [Aestuariivita sp.]|nr:FixH family protein [Aestuariivita sp.]MCY4201407.1 FixH family protein [Aestuariivita sp.]MCY4290064.1 FixH family protein [Aestuariivita sp.]MCY4346849.1 FixH family protein [Aestuariivita sp.]